MKKLIIVAVLSFTISGIAQEKKSRIHNDRPEYTVQQKNELQVKKLTLELDLTEKQQKEISGIIANQQVKREALRSEMKNKRAEMKKRNTDESFALKNRILDERIAYKKELKRVLTTEQIEKMEKNFDQNVKNKKKRTHKNANKQK